MIFLPYNNNTAYTIIPLEKNSNYQINPEATASWVYRDTDGKIIYVADRIDEADGTKKVLRRSFVKDETSGQQGWITKKLLKIISCISKKHLRIKKVCLF
ncbi:MAG: hypothetical protein ACLSA1_03740 [Alphaproteobacteria bacterium]